MKSFKFLEPAFYWIFGVLTCAYYAVETEWYCSQASYLWAFFAPLLIIPISNAASILVANTNLSKRNILSVILTLNGLAFVVSLILTLALLPLCIMAFLGSPMMLLGAAQDALQHPKHFLVDVWLGLACPFYVCVAVGPLLTASQLRVKLSNLSLIESPVPYLPIKTCLAVVISLVLVAIFQTELTRAASAAVEGGAQLKEGLLLLRAVGDDCELLRACYSDHVVLPWYFDLFSAFHSGSSEEEARSRETYYRVKGRPFNSVARPPAPKRSNSPFDGSLYAEVDGELSQRPEPLDGESFYEYNVDRDFAGQTVGGIVRGLSLSKSQIEGWMDADESVAHLTWKMRFHGAAKGKELRAQILLPPGGVVSKCSLWVNGTRRDAVVGTRESTRSAYTASVERGQQPLLVSTAGSGRVLFQSSTGWWNSDADLCLDITAPLVLCENDKAALPLPMFTERNFEVPIEHELLINSPRAVTVALKSLKVQSAQGKTSISGTISNNDLSNGLGSLISKRDPFALKLIAPDATDKSLNILQQITTFRMSSNTPLMVVIDGSSTMSDWTNPVCDVLKNIHFPDASIVWASDVPEIVVNNVDTSSAPWGRALDRLRDSSCLGGQNNAASLFKAIDDAAHRQGANIVWLHGPQPVSFSGSSLLPLLEAAGTKVHLYEYQFVNGPNEVIKSLDQSDALTQVPHIARPTEDLAALFDRLSGAVKSFSIERQNFVGDASNLLVTHHPSEIVQLYTNGLVAAHLSLKNDRSKYVALAEAHGLVTPLTSAVVLEHDSDYNSNGVEKYSTSGAEKNKSLQKSSALTPEASFIPSKPEPPIASLLLCLLVLLAAVLWIKRTRYLLN